MLCELRVEMNKQALVLCELRVEMNKPAFVLCELRVETNKQTSMYFYSFDWLTMYFIV